MKHLLQSIFTIAVLWSANVFSATVDEFAPLTQPQPDRDHETARKVVSEHLSENRQKASDYLAHYTECDVFDGLVAVDIFFADDAELLERVRGNPSGLSRTFWIDVDQRTVVREAEWQ